MAVEMFLLPISRGTALHSWISFSCLAGLEPKFGKQQDGAYIYNTRSGHTLKGKFIFRAL